MSDFIIDCHALKTPDDFFQAVDSLHTAALDNLPETIAAPVVEALERCMDALMDAKYAAERFGALRHDS